MLWTLANPLGFDAHTDHNNVTYIFDPTSIITDISQTTIQNFLLWSVRLSVYSYTFIYIKTSEYV